MKTQLVFLVAFTMLVSCQPENKVDKNGADNYSVQDFAKAIEESENQTFYDFQTNPSKHTWQEVDAYYQTLDKKFSGLTLTVVKDKAIKLLLTSYELPDNNSPAAIEANSRYVRAFAESKLVDSQLMASVLKRSGNKLSKQTKHDYALLMQTRNAALQASLKRKIDEAQAVNMLARISSTERKELVDKQLNKIARMTKSAEKLNEFL